MIMRRAQFDILQESGMTLVEIMVALFISLIVIYGVIGLYRFSNNSYTDSMTTEQAQHQAQNAMGFLERDVKQATSTGAQTPLVVQNGGNGVVIITNNQGTTVQAWYRFIAWPNPYSSALMELQRGVTTYSGSLQTPTSFTTLMTAVTTTTTPFTVATTYNDPVTGMTILPHPSVSIATLTVQIPSKSRPVTLSGAVVQLSTTLTMQGDVLLQEGK
jgi:Tfp pilus assembly protein PilW